MDLLEIRLNALAPYVGRFILVEMPVTFSGKPKPLYFEENKARFKNFPITHLIAPIPEIEGKDANKDAWVREKFQRECLMKGLADADPDDMVMISDLDEIPDVHHWDCVSEGAFRQKMFYYYLNTRINAPWKGTIAKRLKHITTLNELRDNRNKIPSTGHGWHFSTVGNPDIIRHKIESFAHTEHDNDKVKSNVAQNVSNLRDIYGRNYSMTVEMPDGPKWLLANLDRYKHLLYPPYEQTCIDSLI